MQFLLCLFLLTTTFRLALHFVFRSKLHTLAYLATTFTFSQIVIIGDVLLSDPLVLDLSLLLFHSSIRSFLISCFIEEVFCVLYFSRIRHAKYYLTSYFIFCVIILLFYQF